MNQLKELREEAMMTVRELSERSRVSEDTITKIENGHRKGRGITLRKLAKALGTNLHQLSTEQDALKTPAQSALSYSAAGTTKPPEIDAQDATSLEAKLSQLSEIIDSVEFQAGLAHQSHLGRLSERQREVLLTVVRGNKSNLSAIAGRLGCSISILYRDLAVLEEHGLVASSKSGNWQPTSLGKDLAATLTRSRMFFDEALKYIATLMEAYETLAGFDPSRATENDTLRFFMMQESVIQLVERIAAAADPSPLARQAQTNFWTSAWKQGDTATYVLTVIRNLTSKPPEIATIRSDIEGVPEEKVYEALDAVQAAHRTDHGAADPYKNFHWNLKRRSRQYPTTQQSETDAPKQASVRRSDS